MIYKRCGRCGKRIPSGSKCECLKERHKEYDMYSRDQRSKKFYNSSEWKQVRDMVLTFDEMDVYMFMTQRKIIMADTVHHITPLKDDWSRRLDIENLMSLNHDTHSMIERKYKENKAQIMDELYKILCEFREEQRVGGI